MVVIQLETIVTSLDNVYFIVVGLVLTVVFLIFLMSVKMVLVMYLITVSVMMDGLEWTVLNQYVIRNVIQLEDNLQHLIPVVKCLGFRGYDQSNIQWSREFIILISDTCTCNVMFVVRNEEMFLRKKRKERELLYKYLSLLIILEMYKQFKTTYW